MWGSQSWPRPPFRRLDKLESLSAGRNARPTKALVVCVALLFVGCNQEPRLRVGSKNFSEQLVLGEIVAQHLENRLHGRVSRRLDLGGTLLAHQAMIAGDIDVYPEYTGTALTAVLKQKP